MNLGPQVPTASWGWLRFILYATAIVLVLASLAAGLYGRFADLGGRQMAVDEYYMTQSVRFILESGLPSFPDGGYYVRAILYQYLTAALSFVVKDTVLAARLFAVLFSLCGVALAYLYSRRFLDRPLALAVALALLVSSWDIEMARFARMYSMFQFMTLLFLLAYDEAFFRLRRGLLYAPHALVVLTVLTHELGIVLAPLLFVPVVFGLKNKLFRSWAEILRFTLAGVATLFICYFLISFNFHDFGVTDAWPDDFTFGESSRFAAPAFPFWSLSDNPVHNLAAVIALMGVAALGLLGARRIGIAVTDADIVLALALISAIAHLLVVAVLLLALLVFRYGIPPTRKHAIRAYLMLALTLLTAAAWLAYAMSNQEWIGRVDDGQFKLLWSLRRTFLGWPDFYTLHLIPWLRELPDMGLLIGLALAYTAIVMLREPLPKLLRHPAAIVVLVMFELSVLSSNAGALRYVYFLYAVMLCALAWALNDGLIRISGWLRHSAVPYPSFLAVPLFLCAFAWTSDFNPSHIANVTSEEVNFRTGRFSRFEALWYSRADYKSVADYVDKQRSEGDGSRVITVAPQPLQFYVKTGLAVYSNINSPYFADVSRAKGTVNIWSGDPLLATEAAVRDYTRDTKVVWLIRDKSYAEFNPLRIEETWAGRLIGYSRDWESSDKRLEVIRIELASVD